MSFNCDASSHQKLRKLKGLIMNDHDVDSNDYDIKKQYNQRFNSCCLFQTGFEKMAYTDGQLFVTA